MSSQIEIVNKALGHIRAQSINSFNEQSVNAQYAALYYDQARQTMLTTHNWKFARAKRPLALRSDIDLFDWAYAYQYPSNCLRINRLLSQVEKVSNTSGGFAYRPEYDDALYQARKAYGKIPYATEIVDGERIIGANEPELWVDMRVDATDPNVYDALFENAFSWHLGAMLAIPIIGGDVGRAEANRCLQMYENILNQAIAEDLNEQHYPTPDSELITARD